jgi:dTDP-4-amino-4,6-dideoxygalactose transaminase
MRGIFERRYYTNQGPLTREFESRLQQFLGAKHVICVTNATIGLMMASEALAIEGRVLIPGVCNLAVEHALAWCGVEAIACDVDPNGQISFASVLAAITEAPDRVNAIVGANLWGGACDADALSRLALQRGLSILFDSTHAFGCRIAGGRAGRPGALEVFSFGEADILNAAGGACIATDDDELAGRLRNIRSSYGAGRQVAVVKTSNGRMSEAQAAIGLLSLDDYAANQLRNASQVALYKAQLSPVRGLRVVEPSGAETSNYQTLVVELEHGHFASSRNALIKRLAADNIEARPVTKAGVVDIQAAHLPTTRRADASWLELPIGAHMHDTMIKTVCDIIAAAQHEESAA